MYGNLECSSNKQLSGQPGEYSLNKCLVAVCSGVNSGCQTNLLNIWIKKNSYLNKFKLRALDVAKRVAEYPVLYLNESTVLSLTL